MLLTIVLQRFISGQFTTYQVTGDSLHGLALSEGLSQQDAMMWRGVTSIQPLPFDQSALASTQVMGLFAGPQKQYTFVRMVGVGSSTWSEYLILPEDVLMKLGGNYQVLMNALSLPREIPSRVQVPLSPVTLPEIETWSPADAVDALTHLLQVIPSFEQVCDLLHLSLTERGSIIYNNTDDGLARLRIVQGLLALLPPHLRHEFTFSTNREEHTPTQVRLVFAKTGVVTGRIGFDWEQKQVLQAGAGMDTAAEYIEFLRAHWQGDVSALLAEIAKLESLTPITPTNNLADALRSIIERYELNQQVLQGNSVDVAKLREALSQSIDDEVLKLAYAQQLLQSALETRDPAINAFLLEKLDADEALDQALMADISVALNEDPDAVYAFIRTRLATVGSSEDETKRYAIWKERLHVAALASMRLALEEAESATIIEWLRLISREPASYDLAPILHQALLAAREFMEKNDFSDPDLARQLIQIALRKDVTALNMFLDDKKLLAALPMQMGEALHSAETNPISLLQMYGGEALMIWLKRQTDRTTSESTQELPITAPLVEHVWGMFMSGQLVTLQEGYTPHDLIYRWAGLSSPSLSLAALSTLMRFALRDQRDEIVYQIAQGLPDAKTIIALIGQAFSESQRSAGDLIAISAQMLATQTIDQQSAINLFIYVLDEGAWSLDLLPLSVQVGRILQQHPSLEVTSPDLWQMLVMGRDTNDESLQRTAFRRISQSLETITDEENFIDQLIELVKLCERPFAHTLLLAWWRGYVRKQPLGQLQKIDRWLDRVPDNIELRSILQSAVAFRKMLGQTSLNQFAKDVNTTFKVLQTLSDNYDPGAKRPFEVFDPSMIYSEIEANLEELSPHEQQIFANNLKELAQVITAMGSHRTKSTLIRRGEDIDRQLMSGEVSPHSAVDLLKWFSGFLARQRINKDQTDHNK